MKRMDLYGFYTGSCFDAYTFLGARLTGEGAVFRTFAPAARKVSLIGAFRNWEEIPMEREWDGNFWSCTVPEARAGMGYKFRIYQGDGKVLDHCDPYGYWMELRPHTASILWDVDGYEFHDEDWMAHRRAGLDQPVNLYELHAGAWQKPGPGPADWYDYEDLARRLIPYLQENGYTHVELMPLSEHPSDSSWGYQNTGFFSPTSRYGTPDQLKAFVDWCHQGGIGVVLDFVPVHFAVDDYALWNYDGTALYEYPHRDVGVSEWGSCNFMHSRGEVRSFLQSAAHFWLEKYHFDGLRMDAVRNLIYWQGDPARGENAGGISFLREMNRGLRERHPDVFLAAEDSSAHGGVTAPPEMGGMGFHYKWDMGWMNDTRAYFALPPEERGKHRGKLTFSMHYFSDERYLLPLSHDEVVHGKGSMLEKMPGTEGEKLDQLRALYLYMYTHPGKKLDFMGNDLAQPHEWGEDKELEWSVLEDPHHGAYHRFRRDLNLVYRSWEPLWNWDYRPEGFSWAETDAEREDVFAFWRKGETGAMLALCRFSAVEEVPCTIPLPEGSAGLELVIASDWDFYGGATPSEERVFPAKDGTVTVTLPPCAARCYRLLKE